MKSGGMDFSKMAEMMGGMGGGGGGGGELACALIRPPLAVPPAPFYRSVRLACAMGCEEASDARLHPSASPRAVPFPRAGAQSEMERLRRENEMLKARMGKQEL